MRVIKNTKVSIIVEDTLGFALRWLWAFAYVRRPSRNTNLKPNLEYYFPETQFSNFIQFV